MLMDAMAQQVADMKSRGSSDVGGDWAGGEEVDSAKTCSNSAVGFRAGERLWKLLNVWSIIGKSSKLFRT